jgi:1-deoxy-D-xylulose 5-phosphate reductoisomerase
MTIRSLIQPRTVRVNRSDLRQKQRETLRQAKQNTVVVISANDPADEKLLIDKNYFDDLVQRFRSLVETLEITADQKLFDQILKAAPSLREDARLGKLHSFDEAFGSD